MHENGRAEHRNDRGLYIRDCHSDSRAAVFMESSEASRMIYFPPSGMDGGFLFERIYKNRLKRLVFFGLRITDQNRLTLKISVNTSKIRKNFGDTGDKRIDFANTLFPRIFNCEKSYIIPL